MSGVPIGFGSGAGEREVSMAHGGDAAAGGSAAGAGAGDAAGGLCLGHELCRETEDTTPCWVIWDVESCPCPSRFLKAADMFPKMKSILREWGFQGPVEMMAIGSDQMFSHQTATELTDTGVIIGSFEYEECSHLGSQVVGVIGAWVTKNHPPANILFIADRRFPGLFKSMRERNYNVLLRHQQCESPERETYPWDSRLCRVLLQQHQRRGQCPIERENYCWSWAEVLEGRPWGNLKRSRDIGVPTLSEAKRLAL